MKKIFLLVVAAVFCLGTSAQESKLVEKKFKKRVTIKKELSYLLYLPDDFNKKEKTPLMIFLHGAGERGDDLSKVKAWGPSKQIENGRKFPCVVVAPQCPKGEYWSSRNMVGILKDFIDDIEKKYNIDEDRIYITGLSMGGYGSWEMMFSFPNKFAAVAPICGDGNVSSVRFHKKLPPIWTFHGAKDKVVPIDGTKRLVEAIQNAGGDIKFTIYPKVGHDSWKNAYANEDLYKWMFSKTR